eukprot:jgi/Tetstr1/425022/TSEL_015490.t1
MPCLLDLREAPETVALVAPVKKLGEGKAPDVRPVAVREAERRAAERPVVDNMKEGYVSVLAPSQLGVGIPAGDSMLIHGVRLIAEKLGPRRTVGHDFLLRRDPEVQQCDSTLEVTDGAARFNADDGFWWAFRSTFGRLFTPSARPSRRPCVGLEVRFDKMHAYSADMEAARREAPADIEWPVLDGHHGIAVLNVPLGSPEYVHAYMRGKAEELREEVDASLSKLISAKPSRRYTHAMHHHAWAMLKHCMQHKAGYWLRNCLPSEVEAFAEAVDANVLAAIERVLGVSVDPSMYGTDTNPVVADFLAELLHDPDPMAAELGSVLGRGSFNATCSARRYDHFLNDAHGSDSYAVEMCEAWGRLQAATTGHLGDADARVMEREVEAALGSQKELTAFLDHANNSRLRNEIILPSTEHNPVTVDLSGDALMNLPAPRDAHWRVHHDAIADAFRDHCVHDLGIIAVWREVDDLFEQAVVPLGNTVPMDELKDLVPDAELSLPAFNVVTGSYDPRSLKSTLLEFKTMRGTVQQAAGAAAILFVRGNSRLP